MSKAIVELICRALRFKGQVRKASQSSKRRCRPWVGASSRIQAHPQKLNWLCLRLAAVAEIQAHLVNCAARDDDEVVTAGSGGIGAWISQDMTQLNPNAERLQSPALKGGPVPLLRQDTVSFFPIRLKDGHIPQCDGMAYARVCFSRSHGRTGMDASSLSTGMSAPPPCSPYSRTPAATCSRHDHRDATAHQESLHDQCGATAH